jgi:hypothetical protein
MVNKKIYFIGSLVFFGALLLVHVFDIREYYTNESADFDSAISGPLLYWCYGFIASAFVLLFTSNIVFQKWLKQIFSWFVPLGLLVTFTTDVYGGIPQPGRGDVAAWFSMLLVLITVLFILVQRFYFKVK